MKVLKLAVLSLCIAGPAAAANITAVSTDQLANICRKLEPTRDLDECMFAQLEAGLTIAELQNKVTYVEKRALKRCVNENSGGSITDYVGIQNCFSIARKRLASN